MNILDNYNLSNRARNALKNDGSYTAVKLLMMSEADLLRMPNFGRKSWKEISPIIEEIRKDPGAPTARDFMIFHKNSVEDMQNELRGYRSQLAGLRRALDDKTKRFDFAMQKIKKLTDENSDEKVDDLKNQITDLQGSEEDWKRRADRSRAKQLEMMDEIRNLAIDADKEKLRFEKVIGQLYWKKA